MSKETGDWRHQAACKDEDPELFFPSANNEGTIETQIEDAKVICRRCPVVAECLLWAIETGQSGGIWGGATENERRAQKRRMERLGARALS